MSHFKNLVCAVIGSALFSVPAMADTGDWVKQVTRAFAAHQTYPATAEMRGEEGTAKVKVYVGADGAVLRSEMVAPSGSSTLDKEALSVPSRVGHVPAPPSRATAITVPMTWKLT